jgi:hypothetical protein
MRITTERLKQIIQEELTAKEKKTKKKLEKKLDKLEHK